MATEELIEADAQQRPISLRDGEVAAEIEQDTLADASADAFRVDQAIGELALAADGGARLKYGLWFLWLPMR